MAFLPGFLHSVLMVSSSSIPAIDPLDETLLDGRQGLSAGMFDTALGTDKEGVPGGKDSMGLRTCSRVRDNPNAFDQIGLALSTEGGAMGTISSAVFGVAGS